MFNKKEPKNQNKILELLNLYAKKSKKIKIGKETTKFKQLLIFLMLISIYFIKTVFYIKIMLIIKQVII